LLPVTLHCLFLNHAKQQVVLPDVTPCLVFINAEQAIDAIQANFDKRCLATVYYFTVTISPAFSLLNLSVAPSSQNQSMPLPPLIWLIATSLNTDSWLSCV
jgi:hypothetical protein